MFPFVSPYLKFSTSTILPEYSDICRLFLQISAKEFQRGTAIHFHTIKISQSQLSVRLYCKWNPFGNTINSTVSDRPPHFKSPSDKLQNREERASWSGFQGRAVASKPQDSRVVEACSLEPPITPLHLIIWWMSLGLAVSKRNPGQRYLSDCLVPSEKFWRWADYGVGLFFLARGLAPQFQLKELCFNTNRLCGHHKLKKHCRNLIVQQSSDLNPRKHL